MRAARQLLSTVSVFLAGIVIFSSPGQAQDFARTMAEPPTKLKTDGHFTTPGPSPSISPQPQSPAPPLSRVLVYAVGSTQYYTQTGGFYEYMTTINQASTVADHGGAQMRAVVQEIGYGGNPITHMAGNLLPSSADYQNDPICVVNGYYTTSCSPGATIVGFYRYFNLDGYQTGLFTYQIHRSIHPTTHYTRR